MKRLTKSRNNVVISGVCGGIGEYFNIDPSLVRIAWVILSVFGGSGLLIYIICAIVLPKATDESIVEEAPREPWNN